MLSQDAQNLTNSIRDLQHKAEQLSHVLDCVKVNLQCLTDSLKTLEQTTLVQRTPEHPIYEDFPETA